MITFYKPPILTVIFRILGVLFLIVSIVAAIISLRVGAAVEDSEESGVYTWNALGTVAIGLLVLLFYWGIAQAINFLGKTAFYTEQIYIQNSTRAGVKGKTTRATAASDSYDDDDEPEPDVTTAKEKSKGSKESAATSGERTKFACGACGQRISAMTSEIGNRIACPNCGEEVTVS